MEIILAAVMSVYFESLSLLILGIVVALVIWAKDLFNHMENQKQLWDAQRNKIE